MGVAEQNYRVGRMKAGLAKEFVREHHYAHGSHNGPSPCYGLYEENELIGVLMFATPCSEAVRSSLFGKEHKDAVTELHRLVILDGTPRNTESWFIARCLRLLLEDKPKIRGIISFADPTAGHVGTIYKASNFLIAGRSGKAVFYRDQDGRLRHPRQCGVNISKAEAHRRGWTAETRLGKYRYIKIVGPNRMEVKKFTALLKQKHPEWFL